MDSALMNTYKRATLAFVRGEGPYLFTADGGRYLDFCSGIAVMSLGHSHPHLVKALSQQAQLLWHTSNKYTIPEQGRLAQRLTQLSFADYAFFCNSGAEAVEAAMKVVRKFHSAQNNPHRTRFIVFADAFHGRTFATLSAGGQPRHTDGFGPMLDGFDRVPFGNIEAVEAAITGETAGILIEPIQGDGGLRPVPSEFLTDLRHLATKAGILLVLDEVQTGMGRTGQMFAYQGAGIAPDVLAAAKGVGGGFPMGVVLATREAASGIVPGTHGSTFGGNQLACAVGHAVLDVMEREGFLENVVTMGRQLGHGLDELVSRYPSVLEMWRGAGLMIGLRGRQENTEIEAAFQAQGLLTITAADNICATFTAAYHWKIACR